MFKGVGSGQIVTAGDLTSLPVLSSKVECAIHGKMSFLFAYTRGGGSAITELNVTVEASFDEEATWVAVVVNPDRGTPPNIEAPLRKAG